MKPAHLALSGLAALLFAVSTAAHAWGAAGHRTVGAIADALLTDKARAQISTLLADDLLADGHTASGRNTLAAVSVWADEIRSTPANRPSWHYIDITACDASVPDCPQQQCAPGRIRQLSDVLSDTSRPARERAEALKWIVHLVGDLHQPLHAASNVYADDVTDQHGSHTDRGGNNVQVALSGTTTKGARNLHGVWDKEFINLAFGVAVSNQQQAPAPVLKRLLQSARRLDVDTLAFAPEAWALESNHLARNRAYRFNGFACYEPVDALIVLSPTYISNARTVVRQQLPLAGARLANLLNTVLGR